VSFAKYNYKILNISKDIEKQMIKGNSHKYDCPVELKNLRYLNLDYIDFSGNTKVGELIVHKSVAREIVEIFEYLYEIEFPIKKMTLVSNYNADDFLSIEDNNTSAYNCRPIANTSRWSRHAYGKAIDINPIQNPYISKSGKISHKESLKYQNRTHKDLSNSKDKSMLINNDNAVRIFKVYGWIWGGDWITIKDYQHFDKRK
jgi:poly-gamma-glutamate synthesis protein (capsule biosynthesis protein)